MDSSATQTEKSIIDLERQLETLGKAWMQSESEREAAVKNLFEVLDYFGFDTREIANAFRRGELDHVKELAADAINEMQGKLRHQLSEVRNQYTNTALHISPRDSESFGNPIRLDKPPNIQTRGIRHVVGPRVRKGNIEKSMESFIPERRSKRFN